MYKLSEDIIELFPHGYQQRDFIFNTRTYKDENFFHRLQIQIKEQPNLVCKNGYFTTH